MTDVCDITSIRPDTTGKTGGVRLVEIIDRTEDLFLSWLYLFETAFPPVERVLVADNIRVLRNHSEGIEEKNHILAAVNADGDFVGLVRYAYEADCDVLLLHYLATDPSVRNNGLGSACYRQVYEIAQQLGVQAIFFEVEAPETLPDEVDRSLAFRRIGFYRRQGAFLFTGVDYLMDIGSHQPLTPMHIMVHPLEPITPFQVYQLARNIMTGPIKIISDLGLE